MCAAAPTKTNTTGKGGEPEAMEESTLQMIILLGVLLIALFSGMWLGIGIMLVAVLGGVLFTDIPTGTVITRLQFTQSTSFTLLTIPMFVLMGQILSYSGIVDHLFKGLVPWVSRFPGKLLQTNVLSCTMMSAITGSTVATCATVSSISVPALTKRGYAPGPIVGTIGGAAMGLLIPPSLYFIIYGMITETSIRRLYAAGLIPGIMIEVFFITFVAILAIVRPSLTPGREKVTGRDFLLSLPRVLPVIGLMALVLGVIYLGISTVTEAAAIGVLGAFLLMLGFRRFSWANIRDALLHTVKTTGMILFIMLASVTVSNILGYLGIPAKLADTIVGAELPPFLIFFLIMVMYLILGTFLDGLAMVLLTLPVVFPVIIGMGFDPIWFGVVLAVLIEIAQITPPLGFNIYVLQGSTGLPLPLVIKWQIPFALLMFLGIILLYFFPQIALFLPGRM
jgi:tripartite ATP-independent transporter DctM subunit